MRHPFQCLALAARSDTHILIAAAGSNIHTYNLNDGTFLASWHPSGVGKRRSPGTEDRVKQPDRGRKDDGLLEGPKGQTESPTKRRKLADHGENSDSISAEIVLETDTNTIASSKPSKPAVIKLITTTDAKHVIAVTGDDKCIHVFDLLDDGSLQHLSERQMPKRPCAITLAPDDSTILCADKFGDVFSLPLLGSTVATDEHSGESPDSKTLNGQGSTSVVTGFVPAASSLTVHTRRNREALRNQLKKTNRPAEKKAFNFEHQLLLGHVSLLTDLAYVTLTEQASSSGGRGSYILTSDRDEHIRVSRGPPQAHIVEGYCLGHTEFVSKIVVPYWRQELLISGGGDDYLIVWDWLSGNALHRVDISKHYTLWRDSANLLSAKSDVHRLQANVNGGDSNSGNGSGMFAVSGMWVMKNEEQLWPIGEGEVFVALEGVPALFQWSITSDWLMEFRQCHSLHGNVLDVVVLEREAAIMVSIDNVHEAGSTETIRAGNTQEEVLRLQILNLATATERSLHAHTLDLVSFSKKVSNDGSIGAQQVGGDVQGWQKALSKSLYGVEHLRKRSSEG